MTSARSCSPSKLVTATWKAPALVSWQAGFTGVPSSTEPCSSKSLKQRLPIMRVFRPVCMPSVMSALMSCTLKVTPLKTTSYRGSSYITLAADQAWLAGRSVHPAAERLGR